MTAPAFVQVSAFQPSTTYANGTFTLNGCTPGNMLVAFLVTNNGSAVPGGMSGFGTGWIQVAQGPLAIDNNASGFAQVGIFIYPNNQTVNVSVTWTQPVLSAEVQGVFHASSVSRRTYSIRSFHSRAYCVSSRHRSTLDYRLFANTYYTSQPTQACLVDTHYLGETS